MEKKYFLNFTLSLLFTLFISANVFGQVRLKTVDPATNNITLHNYGSTTVNAQGLWLCDFPAYLEITAVTNIAPGADAIIPTSFSLSAADGEMGLYSSSSFGSSVAMTDYMQWGSGGHTRENVAVAKGIWGVGEFISTPAPFNYFGNGAQNGVAFWDASLGTPEFDKPTKFTIYPNPGSSNLNIDIPSLTDEGLTLEVFNVLGKKVHTSGLAKLSTSIDISKWNSGLYLVRITSPDEGITLTKRFVKI